MGTSDKGNGSCVLSNQPLWQGTEGRVSKWAPLLPIPHWPLA